MLNLLRRLYHDDRAVTAFYITAGVVTFAFGSWPIFSALFFLMGGVRWGERRENIRLLGERTEEDI